MEESNPNHNLMLLTSFGFFLMAMIALYHDHDKLFLIDICLFLTSVNYWSCGFRDWRRIVDMIIVCLAVIMHLDKVELDIVNVLLIGSIFGLYGYNRLLGGNNLYNALRHSVMHILVIILFVKNY